MASLCILTDEELLNAYYKATQYNLECTFLELLRCEIIRRGIQIQISS
ncbi:sporulation histidine kinase inhibitor Sda [Bacillus massilinigeriensis]|nr:sporulation histidine kinase inhibitor Sda [Bacillus massilionigeriensis]